MSVSVTVHAHPPNEPECTSECFTRHLIKGEGLEIYRPYHPNDQDDRDEPDHVCRRKLLAVGHRDSQQHSHIAAVLASLPRISVTDILLYCDGCGEYSSNTLSGHWTHADLDPASPVHQARPPT